MNAEITLWYDLTPFERQYERSACALAAIREAIARNHLLGEAGREFQDLYDAITRVEPVLFGRVWRDPTAFYWVTIAYELVKACLTGKGVSPFVQTYCDAIGASTYDAALAKHLEEFKQFALASCWCDGKTLEFARPYRVTLPFAIPGTRAYLDGSGTLSIRGVCGDEILADRDLVWRECPTVSLGDRVVRLQPLSFRLPGFGDDEPLFAPGVGMAYQAEHADLLARALQAIARHQPSTWQQLQQFLQVIALKPLTLGRYTNLTHSHLPGAFVCSAVAHPYELADTLIHEFHHNRLFLLEGEAPLLEASQYRELGDGEAETFYSPWRDDLRPLRGLLHAIYVYLPVCRFWLDACGSDLDAETAAYARSQAAIAAYQLQIGAAQLRQFGRFTASGQPLFERMERDAREVWHAAMQAGCHADIPALMCQADGTLAARVDRAGQPLTVGDVIRDHAHRCDRDRQSFPALAELGLLPLSTSYSCKEAD